MLIWADLRPNSEMNLATICYGLRKNARWLVIDGQVRAGRKKIPKIMGKSPQNQSNAICIGNWPGNVIADRICSYV